MVLIGDIVGEDEDAVGARRLATSCASPTRATPKASSRCRPTARKKFWLDRARTAAISQAHQRVQDQRGRRDPARRASATTPTASSASTSSFRSRNKLKLVDALADAPRRRSAARAARGNRLGAPSCSATASSSRRRCSPRRARAGSGCSTTSTRRSPRSRERAAAYRDAIVAGLEHPRTTTLFHLLQDYTIRVSWKTRAAARRCGDIFDGRAVRADREGDRGDRTSRCCAAACSWRCTCTRATATCTPTSRSTPTTTRCCRRRTRRSRAS